MIKLVKKYQDRPTDELKPLFLKILENGILDWHRKEKLKKALFFWKGDEDDHPELNEGTNDHSDPYLQLDSEKLGQHLLREIEALPIKQQQCFLLRSWEGLSVKETAEAMAINENSEKTHYFRAMEKIRALRLDLDA